MVDGINMEEINKAEKIGFALGGLAGNNAFGAGFLQAALDFQVKPDFIAATSGQIFWTLKYLQALDGGDSLEKILKEEMQEAAPYPYKDLNWVNLINFGLKDVYKPVSQVESLTERYANVLDSFRKVSSTVLAGNFKTFSWFEEIQSWTPSRTLKPARTDDVFEGISAAFNRADVGIAINAYAPLEGEEYVYLNEKAREALGVQYGQEGAYRARTIYYEITPDNVKNALWLYQYGLSEGRTVIDGAYYRQILLSELVGADKIFVARPINHKWLGALPINDVGAKDLQTEISFNGCYIGEKDKISLINHLIDQGELDKDKFHHIDLFELEIPTQEGFFDYVFEKTSVFNDARKLATRLFKDPATWSIRQK